MIVIPTEHFKRDIKYYVRKKRYTRVMDDIQPVIEAIQNDELPGTPIEGVDSKNKTYKVRAVNSSTNVGESNGFRIIYYAVMADGKAYLLTIYSKKDDRMIPSKKEIRDILKILDSV